MDTRAQNMKMWLKSRIKSESGMALPMVLALLAVGSLVIIPSLGFAATSLKTSKVYETKTKGLYAAESGIEDGIWRLLYDSPGSFPYSYELNGLNGLDVSVDVEEVTELFGEELVIGGGHEDWLVISKSIDWDSGVYDYTLYITNNGSGNFKIEQIVIDFPANLEYIEDSTGGQIISSNPSIAGDPNTGITLVWDIPNPYPTVNVGQTEEHTFQLSGVAGIAGVEGHGFVKATRDDVGTVWDGDLNPCTITASAIDGTGGTIITVKVGLWVGPETAEIVGWEIN